MPYRNACPKTGDGSCLNEYYLEIATASRTESLTVGELLLELADIRYQSAMDHSFRLLNDKLSPLTWSGTGDTLQMHRALQLKNMNVAERRSGRERTGRR